MVATQWRAGIGLGDPVASLAMALDGRRRTRLGQPGARTDMVQLACLAFGAVDAVALAPAPGPALASAASGHLHRLVAAGTGPGHLGAGTRQRLAADPASHRCRRRVCTAHLAPKPERAHRL